MTVALNTIILRMPMMLLKSDLDAFNGIVQLKYFNKPICSIHANSLPIYYPLRQLLVSRIHVRLLPHESSSPPTSMTRSFMGTNNGVRVSKRDD